MKSVISFTLIILSMYAVAQDVTPNSEITESARFTTSDTGLARFIKDNLVYPKFAKENDVNATVYVAFVVTENGDLINIKTQGLKIGFGLEDEAVRLVKATKGMWIPARKEGKAVNAMLRLPIKFGTSAEEKILRAKELQLKKDSVYELYNVTTKPYFPGGDVGLQRFIAEHISYPKIALENNKKGTVFIQFVVNTNGTVSDFVVLNADKIDFSLQMEATRVLKATSGRWTSAKNGSKDVRSVMKVPIKFQLF